jgi:competence protein ComEC
MTGIALTTLVASIAIAPYAAYHFHKLAQYSLIANMLAMPVVGLIVMPMALATLLTMPFGLHAWPLHAMAWGIDQLVAVATMVSAWNGAVLHVATLPVSSLALLTLGGLWIALWRTRWRLAGIALAALGLVLAPGAKRPDVLIGREGKLQAVRTQDGALAPNSSRANYSLEQWLLADGDPRPPGAAGRDDAYACDDLACLATVDGKVIALVRHPAALKEECARADIVITSLAFRGPCPKARVVVDRIDVWADGAHALYLRGQSLRIETVAEVRGERPWVQTRRRRTRDPPAGTAFARDADNDLDDGDEEP